MVMQAFIDESYSGDTYVLAGCISTEQSWAKFSEEWERLLQKFGVLHGTENRYHIHMRELSDAAKHKVVPIFLTTIERYIPGFISIRMKISDIEKARNRIVIPGVKIDWAELKDPNYIVCRCLLDTFHRYRANFTEALGDERVDFYFDDNTKKNAIVTAWENHIAHRQEDLSQYYGATPRFEDDSKFMPLQAADLLAWWFRKSYEDGEPEKIRKLAFAGFKKSWDRKFFIEIEYGQDQLVNSFVKILRINVGDGHLIYASRKI